MYALQLQTLDIYLEIYELLKKLKTFSVNPGLFRVCFNLKRVSPEGLTLCLKKKQKNIITRTISAELYFFR